ncbi:MAG TPA: hypothetical protein VM095_05785 [Pyrinomonadaceae bacterium]|nr:hypothetical protein [Pyrinomonadaceae bacterium]
MTEQKIRQDEAAVMRRFVGLLMSPAGSPARLEKSLPKEMHEAARASYFLLDTSPRHDVETFIIHTLGRLMQGLGRDTKQHQVVYQGRVRGRVVWPATFKAHYGQDYDPSRYVCREVRMQYDTAENQLLKHLLRQLDRCLKLVPEVIRAGGCCYSSGGELRRFSERTAERLESMERAVGSYSRHAALQGVSSLTAVNESHLQQAETTRMEEYAEVARFYRRYREVVGARRWKGTFDIGRRTLPIPARLDTGGEEWLEFAISVLRANASKEFFLMDKKFHFNGLNGSTGAPLVRPMRAAELIEWIRTGDQQEDVAIKKALRTARERKTKAKLGLIEGINALDLKQARWGVIYPQGVSQKVKDALKPLVAERNGVELAYNPAESALQFRKRFGQTPGKLDPAQLPYYLLIVGSPADVSFKFQYGLDADHAVGRLHFDDEADYAGYVESLLEYEAVTSKLPRKRHVALFSPENPDDESTALSAAELAGPLGKALDRKALEVTPGTFVKYSTEQVSGAAATKDALTKLLTRSDNQPALIFTASHGLGFTSGDPRQREEQGALVCQDWPGPKKWPEHTPLPESMLFAGKHIPPEARLNGLITFSFACYSAGTPQWEDFSYFKKEKPQELSPDPFVSKLPQRMLAQGAMAFIGHVERAWDYSFIFDGVGRDISTFQSTIEAILKGKPIGNALEHINDRYLALSREITESEEQGLLHQYDIGEPVDPTELVALWTAHNDARAYVLYGDPYARINPTLMDSD